MGVDRWKNRGKAKERGKQGRIEEWVEGGIEGIPYRGVEVKSLGRDRERVREQLRNMNISANLKPNLQIKLSV
jgi:hypothetical protein